LELAVMLHRDYRSLMTLVDRLYAAALDPSEWQNFLVSTAAMFGASHASVCQTDRKNRSLQYVGLPQDKRDVLPVSRYAKLLDDDPRRTMFDSRLSQATHCGMGLSRARLQASRTYREYLKPLNIEYAMVAILPVRDGLTHDLVVTRNALGKPFNSDDCDLMNELVPHLARGFEISRALARNPALPAHTPPRLSSPQLSDRERERLQLTFGLSPAQARLTAQLFAGESVREAADRLGITEGSARQYLKRIFAKTGAKRQTDLIRVVGETLARAD
jgi:DNA-binding CsgD family transcriptional regulator